MEPTSESRRRQFFLGVFGRKREIAERVLYVMWCGMIRATTTNDPKMGAL
jgi:hypothetical protein